MDMDHPGQALARRIEAATTIDELIAACAASRLAGNPSNIVYQKKIGIDIQVRNSAPFSFDLVATGSYKQSTLSGYGLGGYNTQSGQLGNSGSF